MQPEYQFYATLLDSFAWYKRSESEGAKQEFLDKVNRVQTPKSDKQLRGMAFEAAIAGNPGGFAQDAKVKIHDTKVLGELLNRFVWASAGAARQVFVETILHTQRGAVKVYGFVDEVLADTAYDIKTTGDYSFPKYLHNWQHPAYLEALKPLGISRFKYRITDFDDLYEEEYLYRPEDTDRLIVECVHLIEFLEANRPAITDRKVFNLPPLEKAV